MAATAGADGQATFCYVLGWWRQAAARRAGLGQRRHERLCRRRALREFLRGGRCESGGTEGTRGGADRTGEEASEVRRLGEAQLRAYLGHRQVALGEQALGLQRHPVVDELLGGATGRGEARPG